jgi:ribose transport system permease protein
MIDKTVTNLESQDPDKNGVQSMTAEAHLGDFKTRIALILQRQTIFILFILLIVIATLVSDVFLSTRNIGNVIRVASILGLVTLGEALVLIGGRFDLSVGSTLAAAGTVYLSLEPYGLIVATLGALLVGVVVGAINGALVGILGANALIVTLGMLSVVFGAILLYTNAAFLIGTDPAFTFFGRGEFLGVPMPVIIFLVSLLVLEILLKKTPFGRGVYAMGINEEAARASGIPVIRYRFISFIICGFMAALGGVVLTSRLNSSEAIAGVGYEFDTITAAVLGGISLFGGEGSMVRAGVGVLTLAILSNLLVLLNAPFTSQLVVKGVVFIFMISLDSIIRQRT